MAGGDLWGNLYTTPEVRCDITRLEEVYTYQGNLQLNEALARFRQVIRRRENDLDMAWSEMMTKK